MKVLPENCEGFKRRRNGSYGKRDKELLLGEHVMLHDGSIRLTDNGTT